VNFLPFENPLSTDFQARVAREQLELSLHPAFAGKPMHEVPARAYAVGDAESGIVFVDEVALTEDGLLINWTPDGPAISHVA
jgi:hypothetical protein